jgi:GxxExxY protein
VALIEEQVLEPRKTQKDTEMETLLYAEETYAIRGAVYEVYREMGSGFLEAVYQECLEKEFDRWKLPYLRKCELKLTYKEDVLLQIYKPDFLCFGKIIVELKAVKVIAPKHEAQLMNYLKATGLKLGLLVNFGSHPKVEIERRVL